MVEYDYGIYLKENANDVFNSIENEISIIKEKQKKKYLNRREKP